jgi:molybdate-binding protein
MKDQRQRALAYRQYVENAFAHPAVVAVTWYKWRDDPATGHEYGENYNLGIVDITDKAYPFLIREMTIAHRRIKEIHEGLLEPFDAEE